jgi:hypothetical protein
MCKFLFVVVDLCDCTVIRENRDELKLSKAKV